MKHRIRMFNQGNCRPILYAFDKTYFQAALFRNKYFLNFTIAHLSQTSPFTWFTHILFHLARSNRKRQTSNQSNYRHSIFDDYISLTLSKMLIWSWTWNGHQTGSKALHQIHSSQHHPKNPFLASYAELKSTINSISCWNFSFVCRKLEMYLLLITRPR